MYKNTVPCIISLFWRSISTHLYCIWIEVDATATPFHLCPVYARAPFFNFLFNFHVLMKKKKKKIEGRKWQKCCVRVIWKSRLHNSNSNYNSLFIESFIFFFNIFLDAPVLIFLIKYTLPGLRWLLRLRRWASALIDIELKVNCSQITTRKAIVFRIATVLSTCPVFSSCLLYFTIDNVPIAFVIRRAFLPFLHHR